MKSRGGLRSRYATDDDIEEGLKHVGVDDDENDVDVGGKLSAEGGHEQHLDGKLARLCDTITQYAPSAPIRQAMVRCKESCCCVSFNATSPTVGLKGNVSSPRPVAAGCCQIFWNLMHARRRVSPEYHASSSTPALIMTTPIISNRRRPSTTTILPTTSKTPTNIAARTTDNEKIRTKTSLVTSETDEETPPEETWPQLTTGPTVSPDKTPTSVVVAVPQLPTLVDYTKSRSALPERVPIAINFCTDWIQDIDNVNDDDDDDNSSTDEEDLLLTSQGTPSTEKVKFHLRLPNRRHDHSQNKDKKRNPIVRTFSSSSRCNIQAMAQSLSSERLKQGRGVSSSLGSRKNSKENLREMLRAELGMNSNQSNHTTSSSGSSTGFSGISTGSMSVSIKNNDGPPQRPMRRRGSGDTATSTSSRPNIFIAPFPKPLSRENSMERMNGDSRHGSTSARSPRRTPVSLRSRSLKDKEFVRSMFANNSMSPSSSTYSSRPGLGGGESDQANGEKNLPGDPVVVLNDVAATAVTTVDDEGVTRTPPARGSGRRGRMARRSSNSFVKGSKIERFDGSGNNASKSNSSNDPQTQNRMRRALQRREAVKNSESYAEWKLDLMANG